MLSRKRTTGVLVRLRRCADYTTSHSRVEANNFINGYTSSEGSVEPAQMYRIFRA